MQLNGPYNSIYVKSYEVAPSTDNDFTGVSIVDTSDRTFVGMVRQQVTTDSGIYRYNSLTSSTRTFLSNSLNDFGVVFDNRSIPLLHEMVYINGIFSYYINRTLVAEHAENIQVRSFGVHSWSQNPGPGFMMLEAWTFDQEIIPQIF